MKKVATLPEDEIKTVSIVMHIAVPIGHEEDKIEDKICKGLEKVGYMYVGSYMDIVQQD